MSASTVRHLSREAWAQATCDCPAPAEGVASAIDSAMAELVDRPVHHSLRCTDYAPWPRSDEPCSGVMWAAVPQFSSIDQDESGGYILRGQVAGPSSIYLRLSPAPEGLDVVQYGFCPLRVNKLKEMIKEAEDRNQLHLTTMTISTNRLSSFRADKMAVSAVKLAKPSRKSPASEKFQELLGRRNLGVFIEDILRGCYCDTTVGRNILNGRDDQYREMIGLVAHQAYADWTTPTNREDLQRFRESMGLTHHSDWREICVWPYMYNVVMPRSIFEANAKNLDMGIPPIVPNYATPNDWMFNGAWGDACTGLCFGSGCEVRNHGRKIVAGLINRSNLDLPGNVSYWPVKDNPPQDWVDSFVQCIERMRELTMPLDQTEKIDLALHESHVIPAMFRVHARPTSNIYPPRSPKFVRILDSRWDPVGLGLERLTVRECDASGGRWLEDAIRTGDYGTTTTSSSSTPTSTMPARTPTPPVPPTPPPAEDMVGCSDCGAEVAEEFSGTCHHCGDHLCLGCTARCITCNTIACEDCSENCENCGERVCEVCSACTCRDI